MQTINRMQREANDYCIGGYSRGYTQKEIDTERSIYNGKTIEEWAGHKIGIVETSDYRSGFKKGWDSNPATWTDNDIVRIYIKLIEARGEYHQAQDIKDIKAAIEEYKHQKEKK